MHAKITNHIFFNNIKFHNSSDLIKKKITEEKYIAIVFTDINYSDIIMLWTISTMFR